MHELGLEPSFLPYEQASYPTKLKVLVNLSGLVPHFFCRLAVITSISPVPKLVAVNYNSLSVKKCDLQIYQTYHYKTLRMTKKNSGNSRQQLIMRGKLFKISKNI